MNWDALGAIAEAIGSIAVVITLIYLAVQIRHTSKSTRLASAQGLAITFSDFMSQLSSDAETADIYLRGLKDDSGLTKEERFRFDTLILQMLRHADVHFHAHLDGAISKGLWEVTEAGYMQVFRQPGARASWQRQRDFFSVAFREHVERDVGRHSG